MRKTAGLVMVGLGAALIALALALPHYVYPRVAKVPENPNQYVVARGDDITVLSVALLVAGKEPVIKHQSVTATRYVTGVKPPAGSPGLPDGQEFYRTASLVQIVDNPEVTGKNAVMEASVEGGSFDGFTGEATNCCGDYLLNDEKEKIDADTRIEHTGLQFKFPFQTKKTSYPFWDKSVQSAPLMRYQGEEKVMGLNTYRFVQEIGDTPVDELKVPGSVFGLKASSVDAKRIYATTRTVWVEPNTGVVIKGQEQVNQRIAFQDRQVPVFQGLMKFDDETVRGNVDEYTSVAKQLSIVTGIGPVLCWFFGLLLVLFGLITLRRAYTTKREPEEGDRLEDEPEPNGPKPVPAGKR